MSWDEAANGIHAFFANGSELSRLTLPTANSSSSTYLGTERSCEDKCRISFQPRYYSEPFLLWLLDSGFCQLVIASFPHANVQLHARAHAEHCTRPRAGIHLDGTDSIRGGRTGQNRTPQHASGTQPHALGDIDAIHPDWQVCWSTGVASLGDVMHEQLTWL